MKLSNGTLRPGKVIEILEDGKIRAYAPGLFAEADKDLLPPIYPFLSWHANTYTSVKLLDEVWILNMSDNPEQLYWFRKDNPIENNKELLNGETNVEILCNRESGMGWASLYFADGTGWILKNDESILNIDKEGNIRLARPEEHRSILIDEDGISIGGSTDHPAVYGDILKDILERINIALQLIQTTASANVFTTPIGTAIGNIPVELSQLIPKITSPHVTID